MNIKCFHLGILALFIFSFMPPLHADDGPKDIISFVRVVDIHGKPIPDIEVWHELEGYTLKLEKVESKEKVKTDDKGHSTFVHQRLSKVVRTTAKIHAAVHHREYVHFVTNDLKPEVKDGTYKVNATITLHKRSELAPNLYLFPVAIFDARQDHIINIRLPDKKIDAKHQIIELKPDFITLEKYDKSKEYKSGIIFKGVSKIAEYQSRTKLFLYPQQLDIQSIDHSFEYLKAGSGYIFPLMMSKFREAPKEGYKNRLSIDTPMEISSDIWRRYAYVSYRMNVIYFRYQDHYGTMVFYMREHWSKDRDMKMYCAIF